jgi:hypothetical protein
MIVIMSNFKKDRHEAYIFRYKIAFFNVRQKKCKFFHSFAFIKYVIFESVKKR